MNIMGVGLMEVAVILLVGFLVLGPGRSIDMARRTGKVLGDLRRTFSEVTDAVAQEERQGSRGTAPPPPGVPSRPELPGDDASVASGEPPASSPRDADRV